MQLNMNRQLFAYEKRLPLIMSRNFANARWDYRHATLTNPQMIHLVPRTPITAMGRDQDIRNSRVPILIFITLRFPPGPNLAKHKRDKFGRKWSRRVINQEQVAVPEERHAGIGKRPHLVLLGLKTYRVACVSSPSDKYFTRKTVHNCHYMHKFKDYSGCKIVAVIKPHRIIKNIKDLFFPLLEINLHQ